jgi:hypothetical protein
MNKEQTEWSYLARFIELLSSFPDIEVPCCFSVENITKSESPDFIFRYEEFEIGLEITELHWKDPQGAKSQQEQESLRERIVTSASQKYDLKKLPPLQVFTYFNHNYAPKKQDVERLATSIANLLENNIPATDSEYSEVYNEKNKTYFPSEVNKILSYVIPDGEGSCFTSLEAGVLPTIERGDIERAINRKLSKVEEYRRKCKYLWLIIVGGTQISTHFQLHKGMPVAVTILLECYHIRALSIMKPCLTNHLSVVSINYFISTTAGESFTN